MLCILINVSFNVGIVLLHYSDLMPLGKNS